MGFAGRLLVALAGLQVVAVVSAQTVLPGVDVRAPRWETRHGGYVISSNFEIDPKMSAVIYPAEPFKAGDILDFRTLRMGDDEYFVLQECSAADCTQASVLRVWTKEGALDTVHDPNRVSIPHAGKYFMWLQRFPMSGSRDRTFAGYKRFSPPLVLEPMGTPEQYRACDVKAAQERGPTRVVSSEHDGSQLKLRFESGATVFIQRMRTAAETSR